MLLRKICCSLNFAIALPGWRCFRYACLFRQWQRFLCLQDIQNALGRPIPMFSQYQGYFPGVKRPEDEFDNSSSSSAEIKNEWGYISIPLHIFMACTDKACYLTVDLVLFLRSSGVPYCRKLPSTGDDLKYNTCTFQVLQTCCVCLCVDSHVWECPETRIMSL